MYNHMYMLRGCRLIKGRKKSVRAVGGVAGGGRRVAAAGSTSGGVGQNGIARRTWWLVVSWADPHRWMRIYLPHFWKSPARWQRQLEPHRLQRHELEKQQSFRRWSQLPPRRMHDRLETKIREDEERLKRKNQPPYHAERHANTHTPTHSTSDTWQVTN